jgi:hypothetical protein
MTAGGFGRKGMSDDAEMVRRREAFIAAERARQANSPACETSVDPSPRFGFASAPVAVGSGQLPKSVGIAYLLWFLFGAVSAHRHYLGYHNSALAQGGLWLGGWVLLLTGNIYFIGALLLAGLWVLADAFIIPSMCREANARAGRQNVQRVFA